MHEKQVNGPQAGGAQPDEAQWDEVEAEEALDGDALGGGDDSDGPDVEKMRRRRLSEFLGDLVRQEGRMEAAELLGVAYRTLVKAEESGELTGRMSDALERLLGTGEDPEAVRMRERMAALEAGMESLAKEMRDGLMRCWLLPVASRLEPTRTARRRGRMGRLGGLKVRLRRRTRSRTRKGRHRSLTGPPLLWWGCARGSPSLSGGWTLRS